MKLKYFLLLCLFFISSLCFGNQYNIKLKLKNTNTNISRIILAHYYDGKVFSVDTAFLNKKGEATFSKSKRLHSGLYLIYINTKQYFDIFIGDEQSFTIKTDIKNPFIKMDILGSDESTEFVKYQLFLSDMMRKKQEIIDKNFKNKEDELCVLDKSVRNFVNDISLRFPNSSLSSFVNFSIEPEIPNFKKGISGDMIKKDDSINKLRYFFVKNHYWDNANFNDSTLIYTPMLKHKLDVFFNNTIILHPDTVFYESVKLIERSRFNKEMFKYLTSYCLNFSLSSNIMGMDNTFYKIAQKYYLSGEAYWLSDTTKLKIEQEVLKIEYNRIGEKAKELTLQTFDGEWLNLYDIEKTFTVLVFWEPDCGHCKKEMPLLKKEIADKYYDVEIVAIYIQEDKSKWTKFIEENDLFGLTNCYDPNNNSNFRFYYNVSTTPLIYLLNRDKTIIAKKIDINALNKILENELGLDIK